MIAWASASFFSDLTFSLDQVVPMTIPICHGSVVLKWNECDSRPKGWPFAFRNSTLFLGKIVSREARIDTDDIYHLPRHSYKVSSLYCSKAMYKSKLKQVSEDYQNKYLEVSRTFRDHHGTPSSRPTSFRHSCASARASSDTRWPRLEPSLPGGAWRLPE